MSYYPPVPGTAVPDDCICGEINARHCPVHSDGVAAMPRRVSNGPSYKVGAVVPADEAQRFIALAVAHRRSLTQELRLAMAAWVQQHDPKFDGVEQHGT